MLIQWLSGNGNIELTWLDLFFESSDKGQTSANKSDNPVSSLVKMKFKADAWKKIQLCFIKVKTDAEKRIPKNNSLSGTPDLNVVNSKAFL